MQLISNKESLSPAQAPGGFEWNEKTPPLCPACGYDLRGSPEPRCAECGYRPTLRELRQAARSLSLLLVEVEDLRLKLRVGCWTAAGGAAAAALLRWSGLGGVGLLVGLLCGLVTMGCGLQVFRARRLPPQAQRFAGTEGDVAKGVLLGLLGLAMILLSVLL